MKESLNLRAQRGVTLIELLVSMAMVGLVMAAVIAAFLGQNKLMRGLSEGRQAQDSARRALTEVSRLAGHAGWGLSPAFAFDFNWYGCTAQPCVRDNVTGQSVLVPGKPAIPVRDGTDELVFLARSQHYFQPRGGGGLPADDLGGSFQVDASTGPGSLVLDGHAHDQPVIPMGTTLLVVCPGAYTYLYVTATANTPVGSGGATVSVSNSASPSPFDQGNLLGQPCIRAGNAKAFVLNRYRFFVGNDTPGSGRPFLYLDRGIDADGDGQIDPPTPVASDIEDFQVAYLMRDGTTDGADPAQVQAAAQPTFSTAPPWSPCSTEIRLDGSGGGFNYKNTALFPCSLRSITRVTGDGETGNVPGNIVAVRITVVARTSSPHRDRSGQVDVNVGDPPANFTVENHDRSGEKPDGYGRVRLSITVPVANTDSSAILNI